MVKIGIIGSSPENGHPYSFSAIFNGYSSNEDHWQEWKGIFNYLHEKFPENTSNPNTQVTHVWSQVPGEAQKIALAAKIPTVCSELSELKSSVDAVVIARDDHASHFELSKDFLEAGIPCFIDKPLTISKEEMGFFLPYLKKGLLMSCSGLYYATEMKELRDPLLSETKFVSANVLNSWEKYGIHMLDAILGCLDYRVKSVFAKKSQVVSAVITCEDDLIINVNSIEKTTKTFNLRFWSDRDSQEVEISNNFGAFKGTMQAFEKMISTQKPVLPIHHTEQTIKTVIAGLESIESGKEVSIDDIKF